MTYPLWYKWTSYISTILIFPQDNYDYIFSLLHNILNIFTNLKIKMQIPSTNPKLAFNLISSSEAFVSTTVSHLHLSNLHSSKTYHFINLDKSLEWEMVYLIWTIGKFYLRLFFFFFLWQLSQWSLYNLCLS